MADGKHDEKTDLPGGGHGGWAGSWVAVMTAGGRRGAAVTAGDGRAHCWAAVVTPGERSRAEPAVTASTHRAGGRRGRRAGFRVAVRLGRRIGAGRGQRGATFSTPGGDGAA